MSTTRARTRAAAAAAAAASSTSAPTVTASPIIQTQTSLPPPPLPPATSTATTPSSKSRSTSRKSSAKQQTATDPSSEKENHKAPQTKSTKSSSKSQPIPTSGKPKSKPASTTVHCTCSRGDDGSPMIRCAECKTWYHFICVDLSEREAEEINVYICSPCTKTTGRKTAMVWEGIDALEDCGLASDVETTATTNANSKAASSAPTSTTTQRKLPKKPSVVVSLPPPPSSSARPVKQRPLSSDESDDDGGSEDEYVEEDEKIRNAKGKRRLRRLSSSSASSSSSPPQQSGNFKTKRRPTKLRKLSSTATTTKATATDTHSRSQTPVSPAVATTPTTATSRLKRKSSVAVGGGESISNQTTPVTKRRRSNTTSGGDDDPVRKYCLGKLEEVFRDVFIRYANVRTGKSESGGEVKHEGVGDGDQEGKDQNQDQGKEGVVMKKHEEMTEEEKEAVIGDSKRFAAELEQCVFEIYSEPDKTNVPHAGAKYKDRFRMLQFNLSKPDRVMIHQRIVTRTITPKEISLMSSTDLADEETKQHIKIAEKESLEQTILQKAVVPRAKITHKGLQDIEDVNGDLARAREIERQREREMEEEERRERERRERLKEKQQQQQQQRQRTQSLSVPLESSTIVSPLVQHSPVLAEHSWGAPPPVPAHVLQQHHHQQQQQQQQDDILNPSLRPLFAHPMSDVVMPTIPEPELNLADLINIDEDGTEQDDSGTLGSTTEFVGSSSGTGSGPGPGTGTGIGNTGGVGDSAMSANNNSSAPVPPALDEADGNGSEISSVAHRVHPSSSSSSSLSMTGLVGGQFSASSPTAISASPTSPLMGVSPFSSSATRPRGLSFDLNSLWQSGPATTTGTTAKDGNVDGQEDESRTPKSPSLPGSGPGGLLLDDDNNSNSYDNVNKEGKRSEGGSGDDESGGIGTGVRDLVMEPEPMDVIVANDDDFDMFLAEEKDDVEVVVSDRNGALAAVASATPEADKTPVVPQDPETALEVAPHCWTGKIQMPLDPGAPPPTTVFARQIGGRSLSHQSLWWKTLFPSEELRIDGRVPTKSSSEFLTQVRLNPAKELIAVALSPVEGMKKDFDALAEYLKSRDRHGLVFPWGQRTKDRAPGREFYLIPLLATEPLPEYLELLDELKLPKTRKSDYMIGIWILIRGKLNNPPPQQPSTSSAVSATPVTSTVPPPIIPNIPPLPPHLAATASQSPPVITPPQNPQSSQSQSGVPAQIDASALAAEVASLTTEQLRNLMQTLNAANVPFPINLPIPAAGQAPGAVQPLPVPGQPHASHGHLPPIPPWPGYPLPPCPLPPQPSQAGFPPPGMYGHPPPPPPPHSHLLPPPESHLGPPDRDRRDSFPPPHGHHDGRGGDRGRGERGGWREGGRGGRDGRQQHRGGRGKHRGGGNPPHRSVDSGWPRRQRNEDGNGSPSRRW